MKRVRLFLIVAIVAASTMFSGCESEPESAPEPENPLTWEENAATKQVVFADETSGKSVTFYHTEAWTSRIWIFVANEGVVCEGDCWISINPNGSNTAGTYTVNINIDVNMTGSDRTALIEIVPVNLERSVLYLNKIDITQKATKANGEIPNDVNSED